MQHRQLASLASRHLRLAVAPSMMPLPSNPGDKNHSQLGKIDFKCKLHLALYSLASVFDDLKIINALL